MSKHCCSPRAATCRACRSHTFRRRESAQCPCNLAQSPRPSRRHRPAAPPAPPPLHRQPALSQPATFPLDPHRIWPCVPSHTPSPISGDPLGLEHQQQGAPHLSSPHWYPRRQSDESVSRRNGPTYGRSGNRSANALPDRPIPFEVGCEIRVVAHNTEVCGKHKNPNHLWSGSCEMSGDINFLVRPKGFEPLTF